MTILGINPGSHESSACIVSDGQVVFAIEEERLSRLKHARGQMPHRAIVACLAHSNIPFEEVDYIAICWKHPSQPENSVDVLSSDAVQRKSDYYRHELLPAQFRLSQHLPRFAHVSHHLSHASAIFRTSRHSDCAVLVVDGQGDTVSTSIAHCTSERISVIRSWDIAHSLGYFYQAVTERLGFGGIGSEGKTMGLAAYGQPRFDFPELRVTGDGYHCTAPTPASQSSTEEMLAFWRGTFANRVGAASAETPVHGITSSAEFFGSRLSQAHCDFAASAQSLLEQILVSLVGVTRKETGQSTLLMCGGVALNCSANEAVCVKGGMKNVGFFPAPGDSGAAIGAALELQYHLTGKGRVLWNGPFLGPAFTDTQVVGTLEQCGLAYRELSDPISFAADAINAGRTVGWFQDRMEFGPRALGNRSILATPRLAEMRHHINGSVKRRERWRPFAPVLFEHDTKAFCGTTQQSPYMSRALNIAEDAKRRYPSAVHVDGTARLQTIPQGSESRLEALLANVDSSDIPVILNTSLNDDRMPIVCSPRDAVEMYFSSGLDLLIIGNILIQGKCWAAEQF